jgi:hypothetical protein
MQDYEKLGADGSSDQNYRGRFRFLFVRDIPWMESNGKPWKVGLGDEFFWEPEEGRVSENQLGGGIQIPLSKQALIQIGVNWQRLETGGMDSGHDDNLLLNGCSNTTFHRARSERLNGRSSTRIFIKSFEGKPTNPSTANEDSLHFGREGSFSDLVDLPVESACRRSHSPFLVVSPAVARPELDALPSGRRRELVSNSEFEQSAH